MPVQYYTLAALCHEITPVLCGSIIRSVFTQQKGELIIDTKSQSGEISIHISVTPRINYLFIKNEISRARKNSVDLFRQSIDAKIDEIKIHPSDRIIFMKLDTGKRFVFQLYNTAAGNIYFIDENNNILDAFKNSDVHSDKQLALAQPVTEQEIDYSKFINLGNNPVHSILRKLYPLLGFNYINEVLFRCSIDANADSISLQKNDFEKLKKEIRKLITFFEKPVIRIYNSGDNRKIISLAELFHLTNSDYTEFDTVNDAVLNYISHSAFTKKIEFFKGELISRLTGIKHQTERAIKKASSAITNDPEEFERTGNLLLANLYLIKKGIKVVQLEDTYHPGNMVSVDLKPALTPVQNAERYFIKSKTLYQKKIDEDRRLNELTSRLKIADELIEKFESTSTEKEVDNLFKENEKLLQEMNITKNKKDDERPPFRIFQVAGGFEVWVGKSSANNDLLTTKYCKPQDLWFHARGAGGSHTVLKIPRDTKNVPRESIKQAASIAAYYSKMRNASNVPVAYCERKYVRKPKGVPEGTVYLDREEVVFVSPRLP